MCYVQNQGHIVAMMTFVLKVGENALQTWFVLMEKSNAHMMVYVNQIHKNVKIHQILKIFVQFSINKCAKIAVA
jgi:hypothetical protein